MNVKIKQLYYDAIHREIEELLASKFIGNVEIQINFKEGSIGNVNFGLHKSIKFTDRDIV